MVEIGRRLMKSNHSQVAISKRNNMVLGLIAIVVLYVAVISTLSFLGHERIGYVETGRLMAVYPPAIEARDSLTIRLTEWNSNIATLEDELAGFQLKSILIL